MGMGKGQGKTLFLNLFLYDVSTAAGGHLGWTNDGYFYSHSNLYNYWLPHVCMSVSPHGTTQLPLDGFS
jgi:hypothetical protein